MLGQVRRSLSSRIPNVTGGSGTFGCLFLVFQRGRASNGVGISEPHDEIYYRMQAALAPASEAMV
jgi:hypothetical protein